MKKPKAIAKEIFTCHPYGGYFSATRELLLKDHHDGYLQKVYVYKFSHVEEITKKVELKVKCQK